LIGMFLQFYLCIFVEAGALDATPDFSVLLSCANLIVETGHLPRGP
jgi:hypothetical protein